MEVSSKALLNEEREVFVIPKMFSFLSRKSNLLKTLYRKERKVLSIVDKRGNR